MPRFYLHLYDDHVVKDEEGIFLADADEARREAVRNARSIIAEQAENGRINLKHWIDIVDENGEPVLTVPFSSAVSVES